MQSIYELGSWYDAMYPRNANEEALWLGIASDFGGRDRWVLETACGTGFVALPLAAAGNEVCGIDLEPGMLAEARRKAQADGLHVEWIEADMRSFDLARAFPLILLPANTLGHLLTRRDQSDYFACVRRHLSPGGHFVLKMFVPDPKQLLRHQSEEQTFGAFTDPATGRRVRITYTYDYEPDSQIKRHRLHTYVDDEKQPGIGTLDMRMVYPQELDLLLEHHGFHLVHKWGDRERNPFGPDSATQIVVSQLIALT